MNPDPEYDAIVPDDNQCPGCGRHMRRLTKSGLCQSCMNKVKDPETQKPDPQDAARQEMIERELARRHLLPFVKRLVPTYKVGWFHEDLAARLERFSQRVENGESPRLIINVPPRHGKLLADQTPILTTAGWKSHGELRQGDEVFHPTGQPVEVLEVHPPAMATLEVELTNGEVIQCHENHEWTVFDRAHKKWMTVETRWFLEPTKRGSKAGQPRTIWSGPRGKRGGRAMYQLPDVEAAHFRVREQPIHPYFLGVWLGDGKATDASMCWAVADRAVFEAAKACAGHDVSWRTVHRTTGVNYAGFRTANRVLKDLGVLGDKHIPDEYKFASLEQRLELLAGLIDTDGHCDGSRVRIATCSDQLAEDITDVARSLGWRTSTYTQAPCTSSSGIKGRQPVHYVSFYPDREIPVRLERKRVRKIAAKRRIGIRDVRRSEHPAKGRCITVDSEDGLYLAGRQLVPTHNSELASKALIAWHLGRNPAHKVISATHSDRLAMDNSRDVLNYTKQPRFQNVFPDFALDKDNKGAMGWRTEAGGTYKPVGVGAGIAGYGADVLVVDDPHRDKDAYSPTVRETIHRWYKSSALTRLMPGGGVILIQTRWVMDDLTGRVLDDDGLLSDGGAWEQVLYPAIAEKDEYRLPSGKLIHWAHPKAKQLRSRGEELHPERYPRKMLEQYMKDPITWQALYQQSPTAGDAAQFSTDQFDRCACRMADIPERLSYYTTWDLAVGTKEVHDYSVALTGGVDADGLLWIVDIERERMAPETLVERIIDNYLYYRQQIVGIEKTQYAVGLRSSLETRLSERRVHGFPHQDLEHGSKDKVTRAQPLRSRMGQGKVRIPVDAPWFESFKKEMLEFPGGRHDDQVDSAAYLAQILEDMTQPYQELGAKSKESWRDKLRRQQSRKSWKTA